MSEKYLVCFDTDRIKDFIYATYSLKEIRGASALLLKADTDRAQTLKKFGEVIYSAGGGGAILVESEEKAQEAIREIEREFRKATVTASITAVVLSPEERANGDWFGKHMDAAGKKLQKQKSSKGELNRLPVAPYMRLCASCGYLAAEKRFQGDASGDLLCKSCYQKRQKGIDIRKAKSNEGFAGKFKQFVKDTRHENKWKDAIPPDDLNQLGDLDPTGYIGFITADGNHMGKMLALMEKKEQYRDFSDKLAKTMRDIVFEILATETKPIRKNGSQIMPFEIVLIGGDDLMMFTTASLAPMLAVKIVQRFEEKSRQILEDAGLLAEHFYEQLEKGYAPDPPPIKPDAAFIKYQKLTMAAGVVLCHSNFPVPALVETGEALQKNAKKKCSEDEVRYGDGAIDFQVITGSAFDLDTTRTLVPHHRPYTAMDMDKLIDFIKRLKNAEFPSTQLQLIYDACHYQNRARATLATLHTISRLKKPLQRRVLKEFLTTFPVAGATYIQWPWTFIPENSQILKLNDSVPEGKGLKSAFVDLAELYDFVKNEKGDAHGKPEEN